MFATLKAAEDGVALKTKVGENLAGVGELIGGRNEADVLGLVRDLLDVGALSFAPFPFFAGCFVGIRAAIDDSRDAFAEFFPDFVEAGQAALVFNGIVQERRDDFIFTAAMVDDDRGDAE